MKMHGPRKTSPSGCGLGTKKTKCPETCVSSREQSEGTGCRGQWWAPKSGGPGTKAPGQRDPGGGLVGK